MERRARWSANFSTREQKKRAVDEDWTREPGTKRSQKQIVEWQFRLEVAKRTCQFLWAVIAGEGGIEGVMVLPHKISERIIVLRVLSKRVVWPHGSAAALNPTSTKGLKSCVIFLTSWRALHAAGILETRSDCRNRRG